MKKVLIVTNVFPPDIGGPATYGIRLAQALYNQGMDVRVVCGVRTNKQISELPFRVFSVGVEGNVIRRIINIRVRLLREILRADVVYCMGMEHHTAQVCRWMRTPYALRIGGDSVWEAARNIGATSTGPEEFYWATSEEERSRVSIEFFRRNNQLNGADKVVYVSEYMSRLGKLWTSHNKIDYSIVNNGIELSSEFTPALRNDSSLLKLLYIGRHTNWKGIDACLLAVKEIDEAFLTIGGDGPELPALKNLAIRLGIEDRVQFLGRLKSNNVVELMKENHVFLLFSLYEGLSNTLLEAGSQGIACIVSDRGGNPEVIIDGITGILVDPFDQDEIIHSIEKLNSDDELRLKLARGHFERVRSAFSLRESVHKTIEVLRTVY